jgi:hypothetical protein
MYTCSPKQGSRSGEVWQEDMGRGGVFVLFWSGTPNAIEEGGEETLGCQGALAVPAVSCSERHRYAAVRRPGHLIHQGKVVEFL